MGAFGAHVLRPILPLPVMAIFQTAVRYHFWHVLALLACGLLLADFPGRAPLLRWSAVLFTAGIVLFSGSLYALALTGLNALGIITPVGGLAWIGSPRRERSASFIATSRSRNRPTTSTR